MTARALLKSVRKQEIPYLPPAIENYEARGKRQQQAAVLCLLIKSAQR